jgi:hypothetical protein
MKRSSLILLTLLSSVAGKAQSPFLVLSAASEPLSVVLHQPVVFHVNLTNSSGNPLSIDLGQQYDKAFNVHLTLPTGEEVEPLPQLNTPLDGPGGIVEIRSGQTRSVRLFLNEWYPFDTVGTYRVQLSLPGANNRVYSEVVVGPRDTARLRRALSLLLEQAQAGNLEESTSAARSLALCRDEESSPFFLGLARSPGFRTEFMIEAIEGLTRIESRASVAGIGQIVTETKDSNVLLLAEHRLAGLSERTGDPGLRSAAQDIVENIRIRCAKP